MKMAEVIQGYESEEGKKVSAAVVRVAGLIDRMGEKYECMGREDATKNLQALSKRKFGKIANRKLAEDPQMAAFIAEHIHNCYMRGYKTKKGESLC